MTLATRCPACGTVFRVVQDQLRVSEGWVRCGRCSEPFNALEAMVDWPPVRAPAAPAASAPPHASSAQAPACEPNPAGQAPGVAPPAHAQVAAHDAAADEAASDRRSEVTPGLAPQGSPGKAAVADPPPPSTLDRHAEPEPEPGPGPEPAPIALPVAAHPATAEAAAFDAGASDRVPQAAPIELPPGLEVVATDGAIAFEALAPAGDAGDGGGDATRIEPDLVAEPPNAAATPDPLSGIAPGPADAAGAGLLPGGPAAVTPTAEVDRPAGGAGTEGPARAPSFVLQADRAARWRRPGVRLLLGLASVLAACGLAAQVAYTYRDRIAATSPSLRPGLQQACARIGCRVGEYRQIDALSVESSGLVRVEGAPVYRLAVTLRNRSPLEVAAPAIDLALTDAQGQQLARRVLTMADLDLPLRSLKPGSELPIQAPLRIDGQVSGYTVEIFYP